MKKINLKIAGMTCSACSNGLEKYLKKQKGIEDVSVNLILMLATITYNGITVNDIEKHICDAGFKSLGEFKKIDEKVNNKLEKHRLIILGLLIIFLMYISFSNMFHLPTIPLLNDNHPVIKSTFLLIVTLMFMYFGKDILKSGIKNLLHKMPNMDTLVTFSVFFSFVYSLYGYYYIILNESNNSGLYFESICMIIYFIKLGRYIENISKDKTREAIKKLIQITPSEAVLKTTNGEKKVTIDEIQEEDILICKAGEKIAVDGEIIAGKTYVDESFITGESKPVLKTVKSFVIAGSIAYDGYIEYKAKKIGKKSTISEIVNMIISATSAKTKIQRIADKISGIFVPIIIIIAILTLVIQMILGYSFADSIRHFVTILVVACPCALGLAVPLVVVVSNGLCAKKGLYLRNSSVLENVVKIDTIIFDKTGTLTYGRLNLYKLFNYSNYSDIELLNIVANIEKLSNHPISTAFNIKKKLNVKEFRNIAGVGVSCTIDLNRFYLGNSKLLDKLKIKNEFTKSENELTNNGCSIIYVVKDKKVIDLIGVKDIVRANLKNTIKNFYKRNIEVIMLTGDNEITANIIAKEIGIKKVVANCLPKSKLEYINNLKKHGKKIIMVGDGINDAPALTTSLIGISINDGTDIAMDSADVILMNNNIENILDLIDIGKKAYIVIKENLFWAFLYNLCMVPIAMGLFERFNIVMNPMLGSLAMVISSITVVLNSLRFGRKYKNEKNGY